MKLKSKELERWGCFIGVNWDAASAYCKTGTDLKGPFIIYLKLYLLSSVYNCYMAQILHFNSHLTILIESLTVGKQHGH